jgi:hypothetical protein
MSSPIIKPATRERTTEVSFMLCGNLILADESKFMDFTPKSVFATNHHGPIALAEPGMRLYDLPENTYLPYCVDPAQ